MRRLLPTLSILALVPVITAVFYNYTFGEDTDKIFLSISTFLFSIFTGFFIARQASRFNKVRETVTKFDGLMSMMYRASGHVSPDLQKEFAKVLKKHYKKIFDTETWNIHIVEKSTTLTQLHKAVGDHTTDDDAITKVANQSLGRVMFGLGGAQDMRKQLVALQEERIPPEQWMLIIFFAVILIGTASTIPSVGELFPSILKAAFVVSITSVLFILYRLNNLIYTERLMGEHSAQDVLDIIGGKK